MLDEALAKSGTILPIAGREIAKDEDKEFTVGSDSLNSG